MWPRQAFLQRIEPRQPEESLLATELGLRGIPIIWYTVKSIRRRQLPLDHESFLAGDGACVEAALRSLGIEPPTPNDYPEALRPYTGRRIWRSTVAALREHVMAGKPPVFAKPARRAKRFAGRLFEQPSDLCSLQGASNHEPIWCSELVHFASEWRAYILRGTLLAQGHYAGDPSLRPAGGTVKEMIARWSASAFALDLGILGDGRTVLVEVNDALALGAYDISSTDYADLLLERWKELMGR